MVITGSGILPQNSSATLTRDLALPPPKFITDDLRRRDRQPAVGFYQVKTQPQPASTDSPPRNDWLLIPIDRTKLLRSTTQLLELAPIVLILRNRVQIQGFRSRICPISTKYSTVLKVASYYTWRKGKDDFPERWLGLLSLEAGDEGLGRKESLPSLLLSSWWRQRLTVNRKLESRRWSLSPIDHSRPIPRD